MTETIHQSYDPVENIVHVNFPKVHLETRDEIREHFDRVVDFWRKNCRGNQVYYIVNYDNFSVSLRQNAYYAEQMQRVLDCAITIVRYGGDPLQRTAARLYNMKLHSPSRLYESREQALAVVRALKDGDMQLEVG